MRADADPADTALAQASQQVEQACALLVEATPESLAASPAILAQAVSEIRELRRRTGPFRGPEADRLRNAVRKARRLLDQVAMFHARWQMILAAMIAGYTAQGCPAQVPLGRRNTWEG